MNLLGKIIVASLLVLEIVTAQTIMPEGFNSSISFDTQERINVDLIELGKSVNDGKLLVFSSNILSTNIDLSKRQIVSDEMLTMLPVHLAGFILLNDKYEDIPSYIVNGKVYVPVGSRIGLIEHHHIGTRIFYQKEISFTQAIGIRYLVVKPLNDNEFATYYIEIASFGELSTSKNSVGLTIKVGLSSVSK